jgi:flavodoxin
MKALIIYDSVFGNTEKIARSIAKGLGTVHEVSVIKIGSATPDMIPASDLLIIGSPTRAFNPTPEIKAFVSKISPSSLEGRRVASFDTRANLETIKSKFFRKVVDKAGYAAKFISREMKKKGAVLIAPAEGFLVNGEQGPLMEGELERAEEWGRKLA